MIGEIKKTIDYSKIKKVIKINGEILFYLLQVLFILIYLQSEVQPFIYVRF